MPKETADVYLSLGMAHLEVGQNQQALNALNQAIHIKPKNPEVTLNYCSDHLKIVKDLVFGISSFFLFFPRKIRYHK